MNVWGALTRPNTLAAVLFFAVLAAAPVPFGSTSLSAIAVWLIVLGCALAVSDVPTWRAVHYAVFVYTALLTCAFALVVYAQLNSGSWLTPVHPLWRSASAALALPMDGIPAIAHTQPVLALAAPLTNLLALLCGLIVGADPARARQSLYVVGGAGAVIAAFGILSLLIDPTHLLWRDKEFYRNAVTGTFPFRNTAAVYFGSSTLIWMLLFCERVRTKRHSGPMTWRELRHVLFDEFHKDVFLFLCLAILCSAALFLTVSRAGVVLSLAVLAAAVASLLARDIPTKFGRAAFFVGLIGIGIVVLQVMGAGISARFDQNGLVDKSRLETYKATLAMIADAPIFGVGLGAFPFAFPPYRTEAVGIYGVWARAFSTPLEIAAEGGIPLLLLIIAGWVAAFATLIKGVYIRRRDKIIPLSAAGIAALAVLHSMIDYSLQITGYAVIVFGLVGVGLAQSFRNFEAAKRTGGSSGFSHSPPISPDPSRSGPIMVDQRSQANNRYQ